MRPASEIRDRSTLGRKILELAQGFRHLLVPAPAVLADTVLVLHPLVRLSDKVLPLKSYFNVVQDVQRTAYYVKAVAALQTADMPADTPEDTLLRDNKRAMLEIELRKRGAAFLSTVLIQRAEQEAGVTGDTSAFDRKYEQRVSQEAQRSLCTEDVFMIACAFLQVDIAKQGSIYYLKGESPEFRETKKNRNPLDLTDEIVLKHLASSLARPDAERGAVERGQIDSGFNHIVKLNDLYIAMGDVIAWIKRMERDGRPSRKVDVRKEFSLSHTDYERIMSMARREGMIAFRNRSKDPSNSYTLKDRNHERVVRVAAALGCSPQKALNKMLDDFFRLMDKQKKKALVVVGEESS